VRLPILPLRPAQARAPDRACGGKCAAVLDRPGPAAPPSLIQRPGSQLPGSGPAFACVRVVYHRLPGLAGLPDQCHGGPLASSGLRLCEPLIGPVMCELHRHPSIGPST
jgi:hypothetical protein